MRLKKTSKLCKGFMCTRRIRDEEGGGDTLYSKELVDVDRLSELPDCLIHCIMNCLPMGDAVRTSLLSKRFRHSWKGTQVLKFDEQFSKDFVEGKDCQFKDVVEPVFAQLNGPTYELELHIPSSDNSRPILLPSHIYNSLHLTRLSFKNCLLKDPPFYMCGSSNLVSLSLLSVHLNVELLEALISKSAKLRSLVLINLNIIGNTILVVDASELRTLEYRSSQSSLRLSYLPCLTSATIYSKIEFPPQKLERSSFEQFLNLMPKIGDLNLGDTAVSSLIDRKVAENEPNVSNLVASPKMLSCAMSLIRTSLNLKWLEFNFGEVILHTDLGMEAQVQFMEPELLSEIEASYSTCLNSGGFNDVVVSIREIITTALVIRKKRSGRSS